MGEETRATRPDRVASRRHIVQMIVAGVLASAAGIAFGIWIDWFPAAASTAAGPIDTLWDVLVIASVPVFVLVTVVVLWAVGIFRRRPGEEDLDGPPIHGNTKLEVLWTAVPSLLIIGLCAYAWVVLVDIEEAPADDRTALGGATDVAAERRVQVIGEQFAWSFRYDEGGKRFTSNRLHLPAGESVRFDVVSKDVIHDFWIPDFRLKIDAVPGITTGFRTTPRTDAIGEHAIVCAELCGLGHAYMRQIAVVQPPEEFRAWVQRMSSKRSAGAGGGGGEEQAGAVDGKQIFVAGDPDSGAIACGACHTLADAGTRSQTGPDLDEAIAGMSPEEIRRAIVDPGQQITQGFAEGIMPANYGETLSDAQLDALVDYLAEATK